jgi:hypothetical protein
MGKPFDIEHLVKAVVDWYLPVDVVASRFSTAAILCPGLPICHIRKKMIGSATPAIRIASYMQDPMGVFFSRNLRQPFNIAPTEDRATMRKEHVDRVVVHVVKVVAPTPITCDMRHTISFEARVPRQLGWVTFTEIAKN